MIFAYPIDIIVCIENLNSTFFDLSILGKFLLNVHREIILCISVIRKYYEKEHISITASNYIYFRIYSYRDSFC